MDEAKTRVLLVDDEPALVRTYARALEPYQPLRAHDGLEACKILSETPVDVVLCDLEMPGMSGLDLMRWAKEHCPHPVWIVVTGRSTFDAAAQALKVGAFDFVCKPILSPLQLQTVVANAAHHQAFVAERALLLQSLADNNRKLEAANAVLVEQQAMLEQDLQRAERIMRALMPRELRRIENLQVNVAYRPSKAIGGDFYGAEWLGDRHLAVYIADVAGHGVSAALLAVLFKQRLSPVDSRTGPRSPALVLADLNRDLFEECRASGLFVTAAYGLIDTVSRTVVVASAGHPPGVVVPRSGVVTHLEKTGPALGLSAGAEYAEHRSSLADGDRVLFYTDGLTDAMSEGAPNLETILALVGSDAEDGSSAVARLIGWTEESKRADDDMTVLLVSAREGDSTFDSQQAAVTPVHANDCTLAVGCAERSSFIVVRGHATWKDAAVFRATCIEALDAERDVVVDLSRCTMLDSTLLGTLHELVVRAGATHPLRIQGANDELRELFAELAMIEVTSSLSSAMMPPPAKLSDLRGDAKAAQGLVLQAHELLAGLSANNAAQFGPVIEALREAH